MMTETKAAFTIDASEVNVVMAWFTSGRGARVWRSDEIGTHRADQLTPGDAPSPHWAYRTSTPIEPRDIMVSTRVPVSTPAPVFAQLKRRYYGISIKSEAACDRKAKLLGPDVQWDVDYCEYGKARLKFYREALAPFGWSEV